MGIPWLTNPLTNPLGRPVVILLLVMFGGAAIALLILHLWRRVSFHRNTPLPAGATLERVLWQRYRSWLLIAVLFVGATLSGPLAMAVLCAFLCWQGGQEYALLTSMSIRHRLVLILGGWVTLVAVLVFGSGTLAVAPILAFFLWSILALQPTEPDAEVGRRFTASITGLWGYLYLGWLPAYLLALSAGKAPGLVLVVGLGVALSDIGAFCLGKRLRGPKLAPLLSPNKTWSGVLGNLLGAAVALLLSMFALPHLTLWQLGLLVLAIGLGSVWGDLLESLLKRQCGVKDAGELLPGFGGLLDRIDSLLLVAPLVYYLVLLLIE
jgi:phosphatidate cytidylyltransferase